MNENIILKKRGRKPKNYINNILPNNEIPHNINSEDENIILHLSINPNNIDVDNEPNINTEDIFITNTKIINTINKSEQEYLESSTDILNVYNNINKILIHNFNSSNIKCWWCKNIFDTPAIQLPDHYTNSTFYCSGNFCSFNCMKSHNLDLNDTLTFKRNSLINLLYYLTYKNNKDIIPAPHWLTLQEYGGNLTIDQFRQNSIINTKEYLVLHPPIISRQMQIEESYKIHKIKDVSINKINKIYSDIDSDYALKRNKPLQVKQLSLEATMGIVKKKKLK